jgi:DNA-binding transcriptional LysR family regulator
MLNATFRQLEVFVTVAEAGSFARAAELLDISQPGISRHVKALEDQAGGPLVERHAGRRSELTPLGQIVLNYAPMLLRDLHAMRNAMQVERSAQRMQRVRISGFPYVMEHLIRPLLPDFLSAHPNAAIEFLPVSRALLEQQTKTLDADLGFITSVAETDGNCDILCLLPCGVVAGAVHPLASATSVTVEMLREAAFVLPLPNTSFAASVLRVLAEIGIADVKIAARAQQIEVIKDLVIRGKGIAHMPLDLAREELASGRIVRLPLAVKPLKLGILVANHARANTMAARFAAFVREVLHERHHDLLESV